MSRSSGCGKNREVTGRGVYESRSLPPEGKVWVGDAKQLRLVVLIPNSQVGYGRQSEVNQSEVVGRGRGVCSREAPGNGREPENRRSLISTAKREDTKREPTGRAVQPCASLLLLDFFNPRVLGGTRRRRLHLWGACDPGCAATRAKTQSCAAEPEACWSPPLPPPPGPAASLIIRGAPCRRGVAQCQRRGPDPGGELSWRGARGG